MTYQPRMLRPAQRGRFGVLALHPRNRPTPEEMAFDKLVLWVPGNLRSALAEPPDPLAVLDSYRDTLDHRARQRSGTWQPPGKHAARFKTQSERCGTISSASVLVQLNEPSHDLNVTLTINPTRTLVHALSRIPADCVALEELDRLPVDQFFADNPETTAQAATRTLDGADNALHDLDIIINRLGHNLHASFMAVFERKIREWVIETVAPAYYGFTHDVGGTVLTATSDEHRVALDWSKMRVRYAEVYCERRHGNAVGLMDRLASTVLAAHREMEWRTYEIGEIGGRDACSATIGIKPTSRTEQVYYAKEADRVRIETRYKSRVRDNLRGAPISTTSPLHDMLQRLQTDTCGRLKWDAFCSMAEEPPTPLISDVARLAGVIARCASAARVAPEPLFTTLFGTGGIDEGPRDSNFPARLIRRLADAGVIHCDNLQRRCRPGQVRRHYLREPYLGVASALQAAFGSAVNATDEA